MKNILYKSIRDRLNRKIKLMSIAGKTIFDDTQTSELAKAQRSSVVVNSEFDTRGDNSVSIGSPHTNVFPVLDQDGKQFPTLNSNTDISVKEEPGKAYDKAEDKDIKNVGKLTSNINGDKGKYRLTEQTDMPEKYTSNKYYGIQDGNNTPLNRGFFYDSRNKNV
jgi:hypothetical protein